VYNQSLEISETGDIKTSAEYLHSGAKDLLRNSFLLLLYTSYSLSGGLWRSRGKHFLDRSRVVLSGLLYGLNGSIALACQLFVSVAVIRKNRKVTNLENMSHEAIQWFDILTTILWRIMPYAAAHCPIGGTTALLPTTQGDDVECRRLTLHYTFVDILVYSFKQYWISGLSAIHSVSELSGHSRISVRNGTCLSDQRLRVIWTVQNTNYWLRLMRVREKEWLGCDLKWSFSFTCNFLGALAKLRKATMGFIVSVYPSVCLSAWNIGFHVNLYLRIFLKSVEKIQV
jgi:hypothetical protein